MQLWCEQFHIGTEFSSLLFRTSKTSFMKTVGIVLLVIGIVMTLFTGFTLITKKKVVDVGPIEVNKEEKTPIYWSPITGGVLAVAGLVIILMGKRK